MITFSLGLMQSMSMLFGVGLLCQILASFRCNLWKPNSLVGWDEFFKHIEFEVGESSAFWNDCGAARVFKNVYLWRFFNELDSQLCE